MRFALVHSGETNSSNAGIAERARRMHVPAPAQNCVENRQPYRSGDITDDVVKLQVHLIQRFLHVLDVARHHIDEAGPMSQ